MNKAALYSTAAAACMLSAAVQAAPLVVAGGQTFNNTAPLVVDGNSINDGTINNLAELQNFSGTFDNNSVLNNVDTFWQRQGAFNNNNGGLFLNSGRFDVYYNLNNRAGGVVTGAGHFELFGATVVNDGTFASSGTTFDYNASTTNNGTYTSNGTYTRHASTFTNGGGGVFTNGGQFRNEDFSHLNNAGIANNTGTMENTSYSQITNEAGAIFINSGALTNAGGFAGSHGTIINRGTVQNTGSFANEGTFENDGKVLDTGSFRNNGQVINRGTFDSDSGFGQLNGTFTNEVGAEARLAGTWSNWSTGNTTDPAGITNHGTLTTEGDGLNYGTIDNHRVMTVEGAIDNHTEITNDATLTNNGALTGGRVINKNGGILTNNGTLGHEPSYIENHTGGQLINNGTLGAFHLNNDGGVTNAGDMAVGFMEGFGNFTQTAGSLLVEDSMSQSSIAIEGGLVGGTGTINGPVTVSNSTIAPGNSPGILTVNGDLDILTGTIVSIELGGLVPGVPIELGGFDPEAGYDQLDVYGTASIATGTVFDIGLYGSFNPLIGDTFDILLADTLALGSLPSLTFDLPMLNGRLWDTTIVTVDGSRDALRLTVEPVPVPPSILLTLSGFAIAAGVLRHRRR